MNSLEVVATPLFGKKENDWLVHLREIRARDIGPPHFTLVFPGSDLPPHEFVRHVTAAVAGMKRIPFRLCSAIIIPDPQVRSFHVFLVPDEGFGAIVRLHQALHEGALAECLRPDFPYIPHLTVASEREFITAQSVAAKLNAQDFSIAGRIDALEIHRREGDVVHCIATVPLAKAGLFG
jgi:2'-5' RNA ligase